MPDMSLDLAVYRMVYQDFDYIAKHNTQAAALEEWSQRLVSGAEVIAHYLDESRNVPDEIRASLQSIVDDAKMAEEAIRLQIASVLLPEISAANALQLMRVNAGATAFEVVSPEQLFSGWVESAQAVAPGWGTGVRWDSGWFDVTTSQEYIKTHNLGYLPTTARVLIKSGNGSVSVGSFVSTSSGQWGVTLDDLTETSITLTTASEGMYLRASGVNDIQWASVAKARILI